MAALAAVTVSFFLGDMLDTLWQAYGSDLTEDEVAVVGFMGVVSVVWYFGSVAVALYSKWQGRDHILWFFLSLALTPVVCFAVLRWRGPPQDLQLCEMCGKQMKGRLPVCDACLKLVADKRQERSSR